MNGKWFNFYKKQGKVAKQAHIGFPENTYEREMGKDFLAPSHTFTTKTNTPVGPTSKETTGPGHLIPTCSAAAMKRLGMLMCC